MTGYDYHTQQSRLLKIAEHIAYFVNTKDRHYASSWRKRGGAGAFMVIARKWDRIEEACKSAAPPYDIFECFAKEVRQEGITDDVIDLIGYLLILLEYKLGDDEIAANWSVDGEDDDVAAGDEEEYRGP